MVDGRATGDRRSSSPVLVGRAEHLARLAGAVAGPPSLTLVEGEAGVGKSRLIAELLAGPTVDGRRALVGRCQPLAGLLPLGPVLDALRHVGRLPKGAAPGPVAGALRPVLPELAADLPPLPGPLDDPGLERHRLWRAAVEVLRVLGPTVLVVEDLHWVDEATLGFVRVLVGEALPDLAVVLTYRADDPAITAAARGLAARLPPSIGCTRLVLEPLDHDEVRVLMSLLLEGAEVSDEFAAYLHERTAGIPFAVEEVLRLLEDRQDLVRWHGRWARRRLEELAVPEAVRDAFLERLGHLPAAARRMVDAAAVVGSTATEDLLIAVSGLPQGRGRAGLVSALSAAVLQETGAGRYAFRHSLAAQAAYEVVPQPDRRRLHARAAQALERSAEEPPVAQLARHCREAGQMRAWTRHCEAVAAEATKIGEPDAAAGLLLDVLGAPQLPRATRLRLALGLTTVALEGMLQTEAIAAIEQVVSDPGLAAGDRGRLRFGLAGLLHQAGRASEARGQIALTVGELARQPHQQAYAMNAMGSPWVLEGSLAEHLEWLRRAASLAERRCGPGVQAAIRSDRAAVLVAIGDPAGWEGLAGRPEAGAPAWHRHEWVRIRANLATNAFYLGEDRRSRALLAEVLDGSDELGVRRFEGAMRSLQVLLDWTSGAWSGLEERAGVAVDAALDPPSAVQAGVVLGLLQLATGHTERAEAALVAAMARARGCGALPTWAMAATGLARAHLARGEPGAARAIVLPALEAIAAKQVWVWAAWAAPVAVEALVGCAAVDAAADWVGRLDAGMEGREAPAAQVALAGCRATLAAASGDAAGADAHFTRAEALWADLAFPYEAARMAEGRGRVLAGAGMGLGPESGAGAGRGRDALLAALAGYHQLGAGWDEARIRRTLREHKVVLPYPLRGGPRSYGESLSPREQEVVDLAATGLTSSRIASRLFLSPRTVDHHLARALRKLGLGSRKELVATRDAEEASHGESMNR